MLHALGATDEQIDIARRGCHMPGLAADLVLSKGATFSATDLAARAHLPIEDVLSLWRTVGVEVPDEHQRIFTEQDEQFIAFIMSSNPVGSHGEELLRVLGSSLSPGGRSGGRGLRADGRAGTGRDRRGRCTSGQDDGRSDRGSPPPRATSMGTIFSHHLRDAILRQRVAQIGVSERALHRLAVGFIDLVGFTPLSLRTSPAQLLHWSASSRPRRSRWRRGTTGTS